jgi:hypothetical protein
MHYNFEWDPKKADANLSKHGVSFERATEVFSDPLHLSILDSEHSDKEERWITLGKLKNNEFIVVVHTYSEHTGAAVIRIISARKATKHERNQYENL